MPTSSSSTLPTHQPIPLPSGPSLALPLPASSLKPQLHHLIKWSLLFFAIFALLVFSLQFSGVQHFDAKFSAVIHGVGGASATQLSRILANLGSKGLFLAIPLVGLVGWIAGRRSAGGWANFRIYLGLLVGHCCLLATKSWVARPRPNEDSVHPHFDSFPSGHTLIAMILAGSLMLFILPHCRKAWQRVLLCITMSAWPLVMGLSRVQYGRHYLGDVLASWFLGAALLFIFAALMEKTQRAYFRKIVFA